MVDVGDDGDVADFVTHLIHWTEGGQDTGQHQRRAAPNFTGGTVEIQTSPTGVRFALGPQILGRLRASTRSDPRRSVDAKGKHKRAEPVGDRPGDLADVWPGPPIASSHLRGPPVRLALAGPHRYNRHDRPKGRVAAAREVQPDRQNRATDRRQDRRRQAGEPGRGVPGRPLPHVPGAAGRDDAGGDHPGGGVAAAPPDRLRQVHGRAQGSAEREVRPVRRPRRGAAGHGRTGQGRPTPARRSRRPARSTASRPWRPGWSWPTSTSATASRSWPGWTRSWSSTTANGGPC